MATPTSDRQPRQRRRRIADDVLREADQYFENAPSLPLPSVSSPAALASSYRGENYIYFSLCELSRRRLLDDALRNHARRLLFPVRVTLEKRILASAQLLCAPVRDASTPPSWLLSRDIWTRSLKQGLSLRYPLLSCVPTTQCAPSCYAHDGIEKAIHHVTKGVLNYLLGHIYELSAPPVRAFIRNALRPHLLAGIAEAHAEVARLSSSFNREPRIRFSHVGEVVATSTFANDLAEDISRLSNGSVACVVYTRHPAARLLDPSLFVINFTVDSPEDSRAAYRPSAARLVSSAWEGRLNPDAAVNFLEHHVRTHHPPFGTGPVCPATLPKTPEPYCDVVRCDLCFRR